MQLPRSPGHYGFAHSASMRLRDSDPFHMARDVTNDLPVAATSVVGPSRQGWSETEILRTSFRPFASSLPPTPCACMGSFGTPSISGCLRATFVNVLVHCLPLSIPNVGMTTFATRRNIVAPRAVFSPACLTGALKRGRSRGPNFANKREFVPLRIATVSSEKISRVMGS